MNRESLELSLKERETYFWSRSRGRLWHKGETSENTQKIERLEADCDSDALLVSVNPDGPACHTGQVSCFHEELFKSVSVSAPSDSDPSGQRPFLRTVDQLLQVIKSRKAQMPEGSYTTYLFAKGLDKILKKIGEESAETIIAAKNRSKSELTMESADLLYHLLVLFVNEELELENVLEELEKRAQKKKALQS